MNSCIFVGKLIADPKLIEVRDTHVVHFSLAIEDYRRDKSGEKHRYVDYFDFEAWDSGAKTINAFFKRGDVMVVESEARRSRWNSTGDFNREIVFRVKEFKAI